MLYFLEAYRPLFSFIFKTTLLATDYNHQKGDIYLVFEFMDYDLGGLLNKGVEFTLPEIKCLSKQLFSGAEQA